MRTRLLSIIGDSGPCQARSSLPPEYNQWRRQFATTARHQKELDNIPPNILEARRKAAAARDGKLKTLGAGDGLLDLVRPQVSSDQARKYLGPTSAQKLPEFRQRYVNADRLPSLEYSQEIDTELLPKAKRKPVDMTDGGISDTRQNLSIALSKLLEGERDGSLQTYTGARHLANQARRLLSLSFDLSETEICAKTKALLGRHPSLAGLSNCQLLSRIDPASVCLSAMAIALERQWGPQPCLSLANFNSLWQNIADFQDTKLSPFVEWPTAADFRSRMQEVVKFGVIISSINTAIVSMQLLVKRRSLDLSCSDLANFSLSLRKLILSQPEHPEFNARLRLCMHAVLDAYCQRNAMDQISPTITRFSRISTGSAQLANEAPLTLLLDNLRNRKDLLYERNPTRVGEQVLAKALALLSPSHRHFGSIVARRDWSRTAHDFYRMNAEQLVDDSQARIRLEQMYFEWLERRRKSAAGNNRRR